MISRRRFVQNLLAVGIGGCITPQTRSDSTNTFLLRMGKGKHPLVPRKYGKTEVWYFNNQIPGPQIRVRQGETFRVLVENNLDEPSTVHWHGLRVENSMDGVPHLTQNPILPGESFLYELKAADAGTFWYHPHQRSFEQVGRGLYGSLVVEESEPIEIDREFTWVLDDWQLAKDAQFAQGFSGNRHDMSHEGRMGNTVTVNGKIPQQFLIKRGERIRIRLVNAANARIFALKFDQHQPTIISIDGQPVTPHLPDKDRYVLAPGMRMDLLLDCPGKPGQRFSLTDRYYPSQSYKLADLTYGEEIVRDEILTSEIVLPDNPLLQPDLNSGVEYDVELAGGARGNMAGANYQGQWLDLRDLVRQGKAWSINGVAAHGHVMDPIIVLERYRTCILNIKNDTAWPHPMHLHGHTFKVLSYNQIPLQHQPWQDTVLIEAGDTCRIAFVADNPGKWMFHCHILEHQAAGMMAVIEVT